MIRTSWADSYRNAHWADHRFPLLWRLHALHHTQEGLSVLTSFRAHPLSHVPVGTLDLITEDCRFDGTRPAPDGTLYVGRDAIRAAWKPIFDDPASRFEPEETFGAGDRVIQRWRYSWDGGGVRGVDVFLVRGGKVAEKLSYVKG